MGIKTVYKENVKLGKDVIKKVEYHAYDGVPFDLDNVDESKKEFLKRIAEALEKQRTFFEDICYYSHRLFVWFKRTYHKIRYGFQRMFKGYDDVDVFETYEKFIERYTKILTEYRKTHVGYVGTMTNEEWEAIIDEMIYHLYYMDEWHVRDELGKDVPDDWIVTLDTLDKVMSMHKNEFFKLFSKYFYHLWD